MRWDLGRSLGRGASGDEAACWFLPPSSLLVRTERAGSVGGGGGEGGCGNKEGANKYPITTLTVQKRRTQGVNLPRGPRRRKGAQRLGLEKDAKI